MAASDQAGYLELVRTNANFRRIWIGHLISLLGDWFNTIALYTLVADLTGSPFALGAVFLSKMLPSALAAPIAGVLVDRWNRRRVMIGTDLLRAVVVLGFLLIDDPGDVPLLYVLAALQIVIGTAFQPAKSASIPNITTPRELLTANALSSATWSMLLALGAALGGFATAWLGTDAVFLLDSATYLISAWFIWRTTIPQDTATPPKDGVITSAFREVAEGWRHLRTHPAIGRIALAKASWALGGGALVYMLTLLGSELSPGSEAIGIGLLFSARGIGTGIGPILARAWFKNQRHWPTVLGACVILSGLWYTSIGWLPWTYALAFCVAMAHTPSGANWVFSTVLLQERTSDRFRGRVFANEWLLVMTADTIAILAASLLLELDILSLRTLFILFGGVQVLTGLLWLWQIVPKERAWSATRPLSSAGDAEAAPSRK
ncbi:MAG: MFS transporter [Rhodothermales bacterium]